MANLGFLVCVLLLVGCCKADKHCDVPVGDELQDEMELMVRSDILVYGEHKTQNHETVPNKTVDVAHSFKVYCIFKTDDKPIKEDIYIESQLPPVGCSVLPKTGKVVVGLTRTKGGNYTFHEHNHIQSAVFQNSAMDDLLTKIKEICQLTEWTAPDDSTADTCPKITLPGFCTNYTLPNFGFRTESSNWVLLISLLVITASMLVGQYV